MKIGFSCLLYLNGQWQNKKMAFQKFIIKKARKYLKEKRNEYVILYIKNTINIR